MSERYSWGTAEPVATLPELNDRLNRRMKQLENFVNIQTERLPTQYRSSINQMLRHDFSSDRTGAIRAPRIYLPANDNERTFFDKDNKHKLELVASVYPSTIEIELSVKKTTGDTTAQTVAVFGDVADTFWDASTGTGIYCQLGGGSGDTLTIFKRVAGVNTLIGTIVGSEDSRTDYVDIDILIWDLSDPLQMLVALNGENLSGASFATAGLAMTAGGFFGLGQPNPPNELFYKDVQARTTLKVKTEDLTPGSVGTPELADDAVTNPKVANDAIGSVELIDLSVITTKLNAAAVTTAKIAPLAVTAPELGPLSVIESKLAALAVTNAKIGALAVTGGKIDNVTITGGKLVANTITANEIAALTITAAEILGNTITGAKIAALTITAGEIQANAITTDKLNALAVTAAKIAANTITATQIAALTITAAEIAANTITAGQIAALTITAGEIQANTITGAKIAANTITAASIAALTITAGEIAVNAIEADKILAGAVTAAKISVTTLSSIQANIGTVTAGIVRDSASKFVVDLNARKVTIIDEQATPRTRVEIGELGAGLGDWGIRIRNAANAIIYDLTGLGTDTVDTVNIVAGAVTATEIFAGTITATEIAANAIETDKINALAITTAKIGANQVTAGKISVTTLSAISADMGTITAGTITAATIVASENLTSGKIAVGPNASPDGSASLNIFHNRSVTSTIADERIVHLDGTFLATVAGTEAVGMVVVPKFDMDGNNATDFAIVSYGATAKVVSTVGLVGPGTMTNWRHISITDVIKASGADTPTLTNDYGINIGNIIAGVNNWALKTGSGVVEFGDVVRPVADSAHDLGTTALRWARLWVDDITVTTEVDTPSVDSAAAVDLVLQRNNVTKVTIGSASVLFADAIEIDGALNHDGTTIGFFGTAPTTKKTPSTITDGTGGISGNLVDPTDFPKARDNDHNLFRKIDNIITILRQYGMVV